MGGTMATGARMCDPFDDPELPPKGWHPTINRWGRAKKAIANSTPIRDETAEASAWSNEPPRNAPKAPRPYRRTVHEKGLCWIGGDEMVISDLIPKWPSKRRCEPSVVSAPQIDEKACRHRH